MTNADERKDERPLVTVAQLVQHIGQTLHDLNKEKQVQYEELVGALDILKSYYQTRVLTSMLHESDLMHALMAQAQGETKQ